MGFPRLMLIVVTCVVCYIEACVIPIQENEKILTPNIHRAGGYKISK